MISPAPLLPCSPTPHWAVGILTSPRPKETLTRTMASLVAAGWDRATIFAEPGSTLPVVDPDYWTIRQHAARKHAWRNWIEGLGHLVDVYPDAGYFLMVQDDVVFARNVRRYIERTWPHGKRTDGDRLALPAGRLQGQAARLAIDVSGLVPRRCALLGDPAAVGRVVVARPRRRRGPESD